LVVTTAFFVVMSSRMIPGMAILTSAANPAHRGMFMSLSGSVQSVGMGLGTLLTGTIVQRNAQGLLENYWLSSLVGIAACLITWWLAPRLKLNH
jgi:predicted MFS family arabinose efflux permease